MIGIYLIKNKVNGKVYVGQSWDIGLRWSQHRYSSGHNDHLSRAIKKYGKESFEFSILQELSTIDCLPQNVLQATLDMLESYYIELYHSLDSNYGYNKKGGGSRGKCSEETKAKMSKNNAMHNPEHRKKLLGNQYSKGNTSFWKGKHLPEEMKEKIRSTEKGKVIPDDLRQLWSDGRRKGENNGNYGRKHTKEELEKMSAAFKGKKQSIYHITKMIFGQLGYIASFETEEPQTKVTI